MIGLGTLINVGAIIIGGLLGLFLGRSVKVRYQDILYDCCWDLCADAWHWLAQGAGAFGYGWRASVAAL